MKRKSLIIAILLIVVVIIVTIIIIKHKDSSLEESGDVIYEIIDNMSEYNIAIKERGYKVIEKNGEFYIVISMGEKSTGGYDIKIKKIDIKEKNVSIAVQETEPSGGMDVTMAFTYPCTIIKFKQMPEKINIYNKKTGESYEEITEDIEM